MRRIRKDRDKECRGKKRGVRRELRRKRMKEKGKEMETVTGRKRGHIRKCEVKKRKDKKMVREMVGEENREKGTGVNKEKKRRERTNEDIKMEKWKEYFIEQLGGVGERVIREMKKRGWEKRAKRKGSKMERRNMIKRLKDRKTMGRDEIRSEAWKYGGEEIQ